ncbi:MAG: tetratricopeptide repeat protein [Bacteroidia bacterium]|nr:tetratricopeptide repeat protein [Bacteroidia bacterium]
MTKVFLSHSSVDKPFVEQLNQKLKADGIETFFDKESIRAGESIVERLRQALDEFEVFICVYSPDYFESNWGSTEWETVLMSALSRGTGKRLLPVYLHDAEIPTLLSDIKYIDFRNRSLDDGYPEILAALTGEDEDDLPPPQPLPDGSIMPHKPLRESFVGRRKFILDLHKTLQKEPVVVIQGMAGVGKTQVAVAYAYRYATRFFPGGVIWVEANGGKSALVRALRKFTGQEGKAFQESPDELAQLWNFLIGTPPELVILDGLDDEQTKLEDWLPGGMDDIRVLITTRGLENNTLPVMRLENFNEEEGIQLISRGEHKIAESEMGVAKKLVRMMGGLPLALELIRNFLRLNANNGLSLSKLLEAIEAEGEMHALSTFSEKYFSDLPTGHEKSIVSSFELLLKQLDNDAAEKILRTMSLLAPAPVPEKLLKEILDYKPGNILSDPFRENATDLANLSLVEIQEGPDCPLLYAHPLMSAYVRARIPRNSKLPKATFQAVEKAMARTRNPEDEDSYYTLEWVLPHAEKLVNESNDIPWVIQVCKHLGYHHQRHGRYLEAVKYFQKVFEISLKEYPPNSPEIASAKYHLGQILHETGQHEEGEVLLEESLDTYEKLDFEKNDPKFVGRGKAYMAKVLYSKGKFQDALKLQQEALNLNRVEFPPDHPYVTFVQANLARVYRALGDFKTARDLLKDVLRLNQKRFGSNPHHRFIAKSKLRLANLYQDLSNFRKARKLFQESLDSTLVNYGPTHPRTARCQYNLGNILIEMEHFQTGIDLLKQALESNKLNYTNQNPNHPYIAKVNSDLAVAKTDYANLVLLPTQKEEAGKLLEEASNQQEEAIKAAFEEYSSNDPAMTPFLINEGKVLMGRGFLTRARKYLGMALASNEKVYGKSHPYWEQVRELMDDLEDLVAIYGESNQ